LFYNPTLVFKKASLFVLKKINTSDSKLSLEIISTFTSWFYQWFSVLQSDFCSHTKKLSASKLYEAIALIYLQK